MKLNKIKSNCLKRKRFNIVHGPDGVQWFTDNRSLWLCLGITIERKIMPELFGLTGKQVEKCLFLEETENGEEYGIAMMNTDAPVEYIGDIWEFEQLLMGFRGERGMIYVPRTSADACAIDGNTTFAVRIFDDGEDEKPYPMVAVFNGMICEALLRPIDTAYSGYIQQRMAKLGEIPAWDIRKEENDHGEAVSKAG